VVWFAIFSEREEIMWIIFVVIFVVLFFVFCFTKISKKPEPKKTLVLTPSCPPLYDSSGEQMGSLSEEELAKLPVDDGLSDYSEAEQYVPPVMILSKQLPERVYIYIKSLGKKVWVEVRRMCPSGNFFRGYYGGKYYTCPRQFLFH
jgi:hypothetical protein